MILSSSLRVSVCVFWALLLLLLGFIHVFCRCIFFPGVDIIVPAESGSARSAGTLADVFFSFAPVLILPSCMWLSMSYVRWFIAGFVCFSCRVLNTEPVFRVPKLGLKILFDVCESVACWRMRLCVRSVCLRCIADGCVLSLCWLCEILHVSSTCIWLSCP